MSVTPKLDLEDATDDEEVELNLPREGAGERDPPGKEVRDLPRATASGAPVTQQEEWYRLEPPNGDRLKWNRPGQPLPVIEEPRGQGAEATGSMDGSEMNEGGTRAPPPKLPLPRQDRPGAGIITPPRRDADRHGGLRAPETRLPN